MVSTKSTAHAETLSFPTTRVARSGREVDAPNEMAGALEPREAKDTLNCGMSSRDASSFRHCAQSQQRGEQWATVNTHPIILHTLNWDEVLGYSSILRNGMVVLTPLNQLVG